MYKFKQHLKAEVEVFVAKVFLPTLQSPNTPEERKKLVLEALRALCSNPVLLTQIFLNYDCDFEAVDLYKSIVTHLTSLSVKNQQSQVTNTVESEKSSVSLASLEVLVVILQGFLKALKLPGGDDNMNKERSKARGTLQLAVGLAIKESVMVESSNSEEMVVSANDIKKLEENNLNGNATTGDVTGKIVDAFDKKRIAQRNISSCGVAI